MTSLNLFLSFVLLCFIDVLMFRILLFAKSCSYSSERLRCDLLSVFYFRSFWVAPKTADQGLHQVSFSMHPYIKSQFEWSESVVWWFEVISVTFVAWGCGFSGCIFSKHPLSSSVNWWDFDLLISINWSNAIHYIHPGSILMFCRITRHNYFDQVTVLIVVLPCCCCCCCSCA